MPCLTIWECASAVRKAIAQFENDRAALLEALRAPLAGLLERDDLPAIGIPRQGNNVAFSQYLYFDGDLTILLFEVPKERPVPPHDHGVLEGFCVYRGSVRHTVYQRADDASRPGYAELETLRDDIMNPGDIAIVAPPADIHGFVALEDNTMGVTIVSGAYKEDRHYYRPEDNSYEVRKQVTAR